MILYHLGSWPPVTESVTHDSMIGKTLFSEDGFYIDLQR